MSDRPQHDVLIRSLGEQLTPVRRLLPPWRRVLGWVLVIAVAAALLLMHYGATPMMSRWSQHPDLGLAAIGALLTTVTAAWAAFAVSVPGRSRAWAWLPVAPLMLWVSASGVGCLRSLLVPGGHGLHVVGDCLLFILGFSVPLSALMIWLLRRAFPLAPVLTATLGGLACASAAAVLLEICHNFTSTFTDLISHAIAIALVISINAAMSGRLLQPRQNLRS